MAAGNPSPSGNRFRRVQHGKDKVYVTWEAAEAAESLDEGVRKRVVWMLERNEAKDAKEAVFAVSADRVVFGFDSGINDWTHRGVELEDTVGGSTEVVVEGGIIPSRVPLSPPRVP
jgi:hypothetical protein